MLGLPSHLFVNAFNRSVDFVSVVVYVPSYYLYLFLFLFLFLFHATRGKGGVRGT